MTFYRKSGQQDVLELVLMHVKLSENSIVMAGREFIWLFHTSKSTSKAVLEFSCDFTITRPEKLEWTIRLHL